MEIEIEAILRTFLAECDEHFAEMETALVVLESNPSDDQALEAIFRGAHTLKGNAASLGFAKVAGFAHVFEELLQQFRSHSLPVTAARITLLLRSLDALRQMVPEAIAGADELQHRHVELLHQLANGNLVEAGAAARSAPAPENSNRQPFGRRLGDALAWADQAGTIRVDTEKLDRMLDLASEIGIAQGRLRVLLERSDSANHEAIVAHDQVDRLALDLQEIIMKLRLVPVGPIFRQHFRTLRDLAQSNGKIARLALAGEDVEVDMSVIEHLKDPITHMVRNALDHGIESPEQRQAQGKDRCGLLILKARHDGANIIIQAIDDGAGLNRDKIVQRARALGTVAEPEKLPDDELYRLIFEPGFSTAALVTELSGRGVGMDVVRRNIDALRGSVSVQSQPGQGTTITMRLPLTLAIIEGFGVGVGDQNYVLPLHSVLECAAMPAEARDHRPSGVVNWRGEPLPYVRLSRWFNLARRVSERENLVVVEFNGAQAGLAVDTLFGARQTVIKPLAKQFRDIAGIAGSAILGDGRIALILDIPGLLREVTRHNESGAWSATRSSQANATDDHREADYR